MAQDHESRLETHPPASDHVCPPPSFVDQANVTDTDIYDVYEECWPDCWAQAADLLDWAEEYDEVLAQDGETRRWFDGGKLNASVNCLDRHVEAGRKNQVAIKWSGRQRGTRSYTYLALKREVEEFAAAMRSLGVEEDDVVTLYMPMIPELPIAMLACARLGAPHSVVFAGFSADALATRMDSAESEYLVTCDGYYRRGTPVHQKSKADNARLKLDHDVAAEVVVERLGDETPLGESEYAYCDLIARHRNATVDPVPRGANDELFLIYTSGTTGEPTGVRHTTGGYLSHVAWTAQSVLDIKPEDTYWCSADIGWITGHSYIVYGPLALGTTSVMYEGTPDYPEKDRVWELIERNAVDVFYTAPTAIRAFMKWGSQYPEKHDLSSLRLLGTVGEPINPRAWKWYYTHIGNEECPIVDTWWQTETGGMMVTTIPGVAEMKPGSAGPPLPGVSAKVVDGSGEPISSNEAGYLVVDRPWPGMPMSMVENESWFVERKEGYPSLDGFDWVYFSEDAGTVDEDGYITVLGRVDDLIDVSGHLFGTADIETAITDTEGVTEAAVVSGPNGADEPGSGTVYAYVSTAEGYGEELRGDVIEAVSERVSPLAAPDTIVFTPDLPKTRSGKIMRRMLEAVTRGDDLGDMSALRNPEVVGELESAVEDER